MDSLFKIAVVPVILLLYFVHKKDPHPESMKFLLKIFGFGCLTTIPVLICELGFDALLALPAEFGSFSILWNTFWGVAFVEEIFKWIVMFSFSYKDKKFDETYDGIVYGAFSSLGFACVENFLYVLFNSGITTGILRAITAVPGHFCYGVIMGYFMSKARSNKSKGRSGALCIMLSIFLPTLLHALYDFFITEPTILTILAWIGLMLAMFIGCFVLILNASKNNETIGTPAPATTPIAPTTPVAPVTPSAPAAPAAPTTLPVQPQEPPQVSAAPPITSAPPAEPVKADSITTISWETDQNGQNNP